MPPKPKENCWWKRACDILALDIDMHEISGFELVERLRTEKAKIQRSETEGSEYMGWIAVNKIYWIVEYLTTFVVFFWVRFLRSFYRKYSNEKEFMWQNICFNIGSMIINQVELYSPVTMILGNLFDKRFWSLVHWHED